MIIKIFIIFYLLQIYKNCLAWYSYLFSSKHISQIFFKKEHMHTNIHTQRAWYSS